MRKRCFIQHCSANLGLCIAGLRNVEDGCTTARAGLGWARLYNYKPARNSNVAFTAARLYFN